MAGQDNGLCFLYLIFYSPGGGLRQWLVFLVLDLPLNLLLAASTQTVLGHTQDIFSALTCVILGVFVGCCVFVFLCSGAVDIAPLRTHGGADDLMTNRPTLYPNTHACDVLHHRHRLIKHMYTGVCSNCCTISTCTQVHVVTAALSAHVHKCM